MADLLCKDGWRLYDTVAALLTLDEQQLDERRQTDIGAALAALHEHRRERSVACVQLGRDFIGCEIDPTYYAIAERRIREAQMQPSLLGVSDDQSKAG